ncbi:MAG: hypothetical protein ACRCX2_02010, partial [Paraclostridium sp.]
ELDEVCPNLSLFTPIPEGPNGVENCTWWDGTGCTHKNYGNGNPKNWPCNKSTIIPPTEVGPSIPIS